MKSVPTFTETRGKLPENVEGTTLPERSQSSQILSEAPLAQTHRRNPCWPEACPSQLPQHILLMCGSSLLALTGLSPLHFAFSGKTLVLSNVNTSASLLQQHLGAQWPPSLHDKNPRVPDNRILFREAECRKGWGHRSLMIFPPSQ